MKQVYIGSLTFERFNHWLIFELKQADKPTAISPRRYRFNEIQKYFIDKPYTRENFANYLAEKKIAGFKNSTINRKISCGKQIALYFGLKTFSDMSYFPESKRARKDVLSWEEMDRIATTTIEYRKTRDKQTPEELNFKYYCLIRLLSETGCRISEALNLTWYGIDGNILTFEDTKNSEDRCVVVTEQLAGELLELPRLSEKVFAHSSVAWATHEIKRRAKEAGVIKRQSVSPHLFRHSVITNLAVAGAPINLVQELAGHKNLNTTATYINTTLSDVENMLYGYSGMWERTITPEVFMRKALTAVVKLLHHKGSRIRLGEDSRHYLIKIPKNVFNTSGF